MRGRRYRNAARRVLRGHWLQMVGLELIVVAVIGILAGIAATAMVLGPLTYSALRGLDRMIYGAEATRELIELPPSFYVILGIGLLAIGLAASLLSLGLCRAGVVLLRGKRIRARLLFPLHRFGTAVAMNFVRAVIIALGMLLLLVPGVVAAYRYAMADYLLATHPNLGPMEALHQSARRMKHRKRKLFHVQLPLLLACLFSALPFILAWLFHAGPALRLLTVLLSAAACLFLGAWLLMSTICFFQQAEQRKAAGRASAGA